MNGIILNPNCSEHVSTLIATSKENYKGKYEVHHKWKNNGCLEYTIDYQNFSFKELLAITRAMVHFAREIRINHFYKPMNKKEITHIDFTVFSDKSEMIPGIGKLVINKMNKNFEDQIKNFNPDFFPIYHKKKYLKGKSMDDILKKTRKKMKKTKKKKIVLNPNCSEMVFRLTGRWDKKDKFIDQMINKFKPWSYDPEECNSFIFWDEFGSGNELMIRHRDDGGERWDWLKEECKKNKIDIKELDERIKPLFSIGNNLFYKDKNNVKVAHLSYSNHEKMRKEHKKLLKAWSMKNALVAEFI